MGDLNCEIMRNIPGCSGKWFMNRRHDDGHGEAITDLMRCHDLFAVDSLFRPRKSRMFQNQRKRVCNATYLQKDPSRRPKNSITFLCQTGGALVSPAQTHHGVHRCTGLASLSITACYISAGVGASKVKSVHHAKTIRQ